MTAKTPKHISQHPGHLDRGSLVQTGSYILRICVTLAVIPFSGANIFNLHLLGCMTLYVLALFSLSFASTEKWKKLQVSKASTTDRERWEALISPEVLFRTRILGTIAGIYLLAIPFVYPSTNPTEHSRVRALCFFHACKLADLSIARAQNPPLRMVNGVPVSLTGFRGRAEYVWLLISEMRYYSFDNAVVHRGRKQAASKVWTYAPILVIPLLAYLVPCAEVFGLVGLLCITVGFEVLHALLHPSCPQPLFWQPFTAGSFEGFWGTHWHQAAAPFLYSLGYRPFKKVFGTLFGEQAGRAAGVLGAFGLSGLWHAWAAAATSTTPWRVGLGLQAIFMGHGLACVLERGLGGGREGNAFRRMLGWTVALLAVGVWLRDAVPRSNVPEIVEFWEANRHQARWISS